MDEIPEQAVKAAEEAVYLRHERGFLIKPLIDPVDMRAALTAAAPYMSGVKVKQLVWNECNNERGTPDRWDAEASNFGVFYSIVTNHDGYHVVFDYLPVNSIGVLGDLESAKAAAQADYENRILSALELSSARDQALEEAATLIDEGFNKAVGKPWRNDGKPSKNDMCPHDKFMYEDCERCASDAIRALKSKPAPRPQSLVIIESPYAGDIAVNESYARACLLDCLRRGEAPIASHLLHTQVLDDMQPNERELGIEAGLAWYRVADKCVVYADRGVSGGMAKGIERANQFNVPVEYRTLNERQAAVYSQSLPFTGETL